MVGKKTGSLELAHVRTAVHFLATYLFALIPRSDFLTLVGNRAFVKACVGICSRLGWVRLFKFFAASTPS